MSHFVFRIRPLSLEKGFELTCDGVMPRPEHHERLYDAVIRSFHIGLDLDAEVRILDCDGQLADTIPLCGAKSRGAASAGVHAMARCKKGASRMSVIF